MSPDDVKAVRTRLRATTKDLARVLDVEPSVLTDWERGEQFPTRRHVLRLAELDKAGPEAFPRQPSKKSASQRTEPLATLADPVVWAVFRKVLVHAELRAAVVKLADAYEDPAGG